MEDSILARSGNVTICPPQLQGNPCGATAAQLSTFGPSKQGYDMALSGSLKNVSIFVLTTEPL
jgi:hypothetical protein